MDDAFSAKPRIWEGWAMALMPDQPLAEQTDPPRPAEFAQRLYICESLDPSIAGPHQDETPEPYTLQWFLNIENQRLGRHGRWIPRLLEFAKHNGETLLGLGSGLGTDWLQYARHGANVVVCSQSQDQLALIRRNFELRGLGGRFLHALPISLPLENSSIDVACVSGLLNECRDPRPVVQEIYRVLKPGGKVIAVTPAKYDVDFWARTLLPWRRWLKKPAELTRFSGRGLKRLFNRFSEHKVRKRHLRRREMPYCFRGLPLPLLERLMGRVLILRAFKPLSAAMSGHQQSAA